MMKIILALLFTTTILLSQENSTTIFEKFEVQKGTNIAHWLSQSDRRGAEREQFFTKGDVEKIAAMGFDHIRLPIDEVQLWDDDGNRHNKAFQLLENAIEWAAENDLRVIVDLHILRSHYFNAEEKPLFTVPAEQEKFFNLWRDLSQTLNRFPNGQVAYELMNEAVADDNEIWNSLVARAVAAIRELEPGRTIVIGSNRWQQVGTFDALKVPENDPNILLSFHFYEPFLLSHYKASWTELKDYSGPVHYPGKGLTENEFGALSAADQKLVKEWADIDFNKKSILAMWKKPIEKAKKSGLPLYCGEFGIMATAPKGDRLQWYRDMIALFEEQNIGYANWNYSSDNFGLIDGEIKNEKLIDIISGKE